MKKSIAAVLAVLVLCIAVFAGAGSAGHGEFVGQIWYYHVDNADDLQKSVDQSLPNKVTILDSSIVLKKQIDVSKDAVIDLNGYTISCDRNCRAFFVHEGGYLDIYNGYLSGGYAQYDAGGAVFVRNAGLEMKNVKISNCQAQEGGGVAAINSNCLVVDSEISNCKADDENWLEGLGYQGGGIYVSNSEFTLKNSCVKDCWSDDFGGGIYVNRASGKFYMYGSKVIGCKVDDKEGGGVYICYPGLNRLKFYVGQGSEIKNCKNRYDNLEALYVEHEYGRRIDYNYYYKELGINDTATNM